MTITTQTRNTSNSTSRRFPVAIPVQEVQPEEFPLVTALQNVGYKLIDYIRFSPELFASGAGIGASYEKRGQVWMPLSKCPAQPEWFFGEEVVWENGIKFTRHTKQIVKIVGIF